MLFESSIPLRIKKAQRQAAKEQLIQQYCDCKNEYCKSIAVLLKALSDNNSHYLMHWGKNNLEKIFNFLGKMPENTEPKRNPSEGSIAALMPEDNNLVAAKKALAALASYLIKNPNDETCREINPKVQHIITNYYTIFLKPNPQNSPFCTIM